MTRLGPGAVAGLLAGALVVLLAGSAAATERAAGPDDELPQLWQPDQAVAFLLGTPRARPTDETTRPWDGALGAGITRTLFGGYHLVLGSQDLPVCGFSPSCSRFSQRAVNRCGVVEGALLSLDRLLRDHPLAVPFYPRSEEGHLLKDDPERYCLTASE